MNKIVFPRNFVSEKCIPELLEEAKILFVSEGKLRKNVLYDCTKINRLSILGVLLFYKIVDYAYRNLCFKDAEIRGNAYYLTGVWQRYGFFELINSYIESSHSDRSYDFLEFKTGDNIIIAPQPLLRHEHKQANSFLQKEFTPKLKEFYTNDNKVVDMIFGCISELIGNFWEHSTDDSSLLVAEGTKDSIQISYADTGKGIITTMTDSGQFKSTITKEKLIEKALSKGITSKPKSNHMGYGLWIVSEIIGRVNGKISVYSEGVYYEKLYGKIKIGKCPYWRGTIITLDLPLKTAVTPSEIFSKELASSSNNVMINFV